MAAQNCTFVHVFVQFPLNFVNFVCANIIVLNISYTFAADF